MTAIAISKQGANPRVCIGIPTFKRPGSLRFLLRALEKLETTAEVSIVVADNDPDGAEGQAVAAALAASGYRFPLTAHLSTSRGIAPTRNVLVEAALAQGPLDYIAMIDDDSWPEPDWLQRLLDLAGTVDADIVRGEMRPDFEHPPEPWLLETGLFQPLRFPTGRIDQIHAAGNFLARVKVFHTVSQPWFDSAYALTGGEDDDFFLRAKELGFSFGYCAEALVHETMPRSRCNARWLRERAYMNGASWANIRMRRRPRGWTPALEMAKIAGGLAEGVATTCVFFWSRPRAMRGVLSYLPVAWQSARIAWPSAPALCDDPRRLSAPAPNALHPSIVGVVEALDRRRSLRARQKSPTGLAAILPRTVSAAR